MRCAIAAIGLSLLLATGCGGNGGGPSPPVAPTPTTHAIQSVTDGDTVRLTTPLMGSSSVRLVNIDAAEIGGQTQEPWATAARVALQTLLPVGTGVQIVTGPDPTDGFGRVLGVIVRGDGVDVNRDLVRQGHAVTYFIWPNAERFPEYRAAQIEAQNGGRGIWSVGSALRELPFEYLQRTGGDVPFRPVADALTRFFVEPADYGQVQVNNRVFFASRTAATGAGYTACPRTGVTYAMSCFAAGR